MTKFNDLLKNLKETLFSKKTQTESGEHRQSQKVEKKPVSSTNVKVPYTPKERTDPLFVQIGFDFGTAYSKCVCRDIITNKAWVHCPSDVDDEELPFLIRGTLHIEKGQLKRLSKTSSQDNNILYNLKLALEKVALQEWEHPILESYRNAIRTTDPKRLSSIVETCAVYFLAGALGEVRAKVRQRLNALTELPDDYFAVNLAVPIADAQIPQINEIYQRVLCKAWQLADTIPGHPPIELNELEGLLCCYDSTEQNACFIYPEVSANVQGFVRSRASSPGIYLFSDTGAGTVDQGIFIYERANNKEFLTYLHGTVLPLGSSYIERYAAEMSGAVSYSQLEYWREEKERGSNVPVLNEARTRISKSLVQGTTATIALARKKLYVKDQMLGIRLIFGGGGNCSEPYESAVKLSFSGNLFRKSFTPDVVGLPRPPDLEIDPGEERWLPRLSVAYGLSFLKDELSRFIYPIDVTMPTPDELWLPQANTIFSPTKDDV
jgi:hypothetical protein